MTNTADVLEPALRRWGAESAPVPLGSGHRGPRWVVGTADGPVVLSVVDVRSDVHHDRLLRRVQVLTQLDHPGLAEVLGAVTLADARLVIAHREVPGADLLTLARGRYGWAPEEVAGVVVEVCAALAVLHAAGLSHGDVAPGNVVVTPEGRPVLVDLGCGDDPLEEGTPGVVAPERRSGARPAGDVHAIARVGLAMLAEPAPERRPGERSERDRLRAVLEHGASPDPVRRPTAQELAEHVRAACAPAGVRVPDASVLARAAMLRATSPAVTVRRTARSARGRHRRARGHGAVLSAVLGVLVIGGTLVGLRLAVGPSTTGTEHPPGTPAQVGPLGTATGPGPGLRPTVGTASADAAVRLTVARAQALVRGDLLRLTGVTVPGTAAAGEDLRSWSRMRGVETEPGSLAVDVRTVEELSSTDDRATVRLELAAVAARRLGSVAPLTPATGTAADGSVGTATDRAGGTAMAGPGDPDGPVEPGAPGPHRAVVLVLAEQQGTWRVLEVHVDEDHVDEGSDGAA